jgi:uncharacterized protein with FMN-binding domain
MIIGAIVAIAAIFLGSCTSTEVRETRALPIERVDLSAAKDGSYQGEFAYGSYTYRVEVMIAGRRISDIKILGNRDTPHAKKAEGVIPEILAQQRNDVDAISGATTTSKALLKAIEGALKKSL